MENSSLDLSPELIPRHIAIIPDGNARWSKQHRFSVARGHETGVKVLEDVLEFCKSIGVEVVTVYAFSSENWKRPESEKQKLFDLIEEFFGERIDRIIANNTRVKVIGDISRFSQRVQEIVIAAEERSAHNDKHLIQIALNYGGRDEIVRAARRICHQVQGGQLSLDDVTEETFAGFLDTGKVADPDLLVRTGDSFRISNFLLYQLSYTEFFFSPTYWPDFSVAEMERAITNFAQRERRFGARV